MKPAVVLFSMIAIAVSACSKPADQPRIELTDVGFTLHLPPAMQHALDLADPGFRTVRVNSYRSDVSQAAAADGSTTPFAMIGDFNHDGANDVAVEGTASGDSALQVLAVLSGTAPEVVQVARFPVYDADAVGMYLSKGPAANGGFQVVDYPDSSIVFHYANGGFQGTKVGN